MTTINVQNQAFKYQSNKVTERSFLPLESQRANISQNISKVRHSYKVPGCICCLPEKYSFNENPPDTNIIFWDSNIRKYRTRTIGNSQNESTLVNCINSLPEYDDHNIVRNSSVNRNTYTSNINRETNSNGYYSPYEKRKELTNNKNGNEKIKTNIERKFQNSKENKGISKQLQREKKELTIPFNNRNLNQQQNLYTNSIINQNYENSNVLCNASTKQNYFPNKALKKENNSLQENQQDNQLQNEISPLREEQNKFPNINSNININNINNGEENKDSNVSIIKKKEEKTILLLPGQTIESKTMTESFENPIEEIIENPDGSKTAFIRQTKITVITENTPIEENKVKSYEGAPNIPMIKQSISYEYKTITRMKDQLSKNNSYFNSSNKEHIEIREKEYGLEGKNNNINNNLRNEGYSGQKNLKGFSPIKTNEIYKSYKNSIKDGIIDGNTQGNKNEDFNEDANLKNNKNDDFQNIELNQEINESIKNGIKIGHNNNIKNQQKFNDLNKMELNLKKEGADFNKGQEENILNNEININSQEDNKLNKEIITNDQEENNLNNEININNQEGNNLNKEINNNEQEVNNINNGINMKNKEENNLNKEINMNNQEENNLNNEINMNNNEENNLNNEINMNNNEENNLNKEINTNEQIIKEKDEVTGLSDCNQQMIQKGKGVPYNEKKTQPKNVQSPIKDKGISLKGKGLVNEKNKNHGIQGKDKNQRNLQKGFNENVKNGTKNKKGEKETLKDDDKNLKNGFNKNENENDEDKEKLFNQDKNNLLNEQSVEKVNKGIVGNSQNEEKLDIYINANNKDGENLDKEIVESKKDGKNLKGKVHESGKGGKKENKGINGNPKEEKKLSKGIHGNVKGGKKLNKGVQGDVQDEKNLHKENNENSQNEDNINKGNINEKDKEKLNKIISGNKSGDDNLDEGIKGNIKDSKKEEKGVQGDNSKKEKTKKNKNNKKDKKDNEQNKLSQLKFSQKRKLDEKLLPKDFKSEEELNNFLNEINKKGENLTPEENQKRLECLRDLYNNICKEKDTEEYLDNFVNLFENLNEKDKKEILEKLSISKSDDLYKKIMKLEEDKNKKINPFKANTNDEVILNDQKKQLYKSGKNELFGIGLKQLGSSGNNESLKSSQKGSDIKGRSSSLNKRGKSGISTDKYNYSKINSSIKKGLNSTFKNPISEYVVKDINPLKFDGLFLEINKYTSEHKEKNPFEGPSPYIEFYRERRIKIRQKIINMASAESEDEFEIKLEDNIENKEEKNEENKE